MTCQPNWLCTTRTSPGFMDRIASSTGATKLVCGVSHVGWLGTKGWDGSRSQPPLKALLLRWACSLAVPVSGTPACRPLSVEYLRARAAKLAPLRTSAASLSARVFDLSLTRIWRALASGCVDV